MAGYTPLKICGHTSGLIREREEFLLPNDACPTLENAFVWRERIKRKQGFQLLGRLRRSLTAQAQANTNFAPNTSYVIADILSTHRVAAVPETYAELQQKTVVLTVDALGTPVVFTDNGLGGWIRTSGVAYNINTSSSTINYATGAISLVWTTIPSNKTVSAAYSYYPALPTMGLRTRERNNITQEQLIAFDTKYSYIYTSGWQEFISGTTWSGTDYNFFWSTNFWTEIATDRKLFWATNFSGISGDPIRYTNGTTWTSFAPTINAAGDKLNGALIMLPYRSRMVALHTLEGPTLLGSTENFQRIRWAAIGDPTGVGNTNAWRDDIRGQGGVIDIPTSDAITCAGFVRDNLTIYCESSTWQLKYTGQSIAPFQIEKVNTELGARSTFSAVQFDTSLVGVGDKGVIECDSFKSNRIDSKIVDLVFLFSNLSDGPKRIHGIRDFAQRLAYWTFPLAKNGVVYPDRCLVYNYENQSWAIRTDCFTCLGTFQAQTSKTWADLPYPWSTQNYPWITRAAYFPSIVAGNQQGYIVVLDSQVQNDASLSITAITGDPTLATVLTIPNHNLQTDMVVEVEGIIAGDYFDGLNYSTTNPVVFGIEKIDVDNIGLYTYNAASGYFDIPRVDGVGSYLGCGKVSIRDNFRIVSKKFNAIDEGQKVQLGYVDVLTDVTDNGAMTLKVYQDYRDQPSNVDPDNPDAPVFDGFFNATVPTTNSSLSIASPSKSWQRAVCPTRANFVQIEWTLSNAQMAGVEQEADVNIDAQIVWLRNAGRHTI